MGKLLFFDIDGTLIGFDSVMPDSTVRALHGAKAAGHKIFLCTGRSKNQIYQHLLDFGFDGIVSATGGCVECEGKELYHNTFGRERMTKVMECFKGTKTGLIFQRKEDCISAKRYEKALLQAFSGWAVVEKMSDIQAFGKIVLDNDTEKYPEKYPDIESIIYNGAPYVVDEVRRKLAPELHVETASYKEPDPYSGEITLEGTNKGTGIQKILDYLGKTREDVVAFGDGANDLEMLDFAGTSVAMGNASDPAKRHADYVTRDIDKDGIYHAMKHLKLI